MSYREKGGWPSSHRPQNLLLPLLMLLPQLRRVPPVGPGIHPCSHVSCRGGTARTHTSPPLHCRLPPPHPHSAPAPAPAPAPALAPDVALILILPFPLASAPDLVGEHCGSASRGARGAVDQRYAAAPDAFVDKVRRLAERAAHLGRLFFVVANICRDRGPGSDSGSGSGIGLRNSVPPGRPLLIVANVHWVGW